MPSVSYPLDTSGVNPLNLVQNEIHTVNEAHYRDYFFVVPNFAPFFVDNFSMVIVRNGIEVPLVEDVDFSFALPYISGTRSTGKQMYGALTLHNLEMNGILKIVSYQTIGGDQICDKLHVLTYLADKAYNPRTTVWDIVTNVPNAFPPTPHYQDYDDFKGQESVVLALQQIRDAIASNSSLTREKIEEFLDFFTGVDMSMYLKSSGDDVTGKLRFLYTPTEDEDGVNLEYVRDNYVSNSALSSTLSNYTDTTAINALLNDKLSLSGGAVTGNISIIATPTDPDHLINRGYVDSATSTLATAINNLNTSLSDILNNMATTDYVDAKINEVLGYYALRKGK